MTLLRRQGLWLLLATLAGIVGASLIYSTRSIAYTSTAQVDVESHIVALTTPVPPNMTTETQVATSGVVGTRTAKAIGVSPDNLSSHLSAKVTGTANILSISCTMATPAAARRCANAAAAAYIGFRNMASSSKTDKAHDPLRATLVTTASLPGGPAGPGKRILLPLGALLGLLLGIGGTLVRDHFDDRVRDRADLERCLDAPVVAEVTRVSRSAWWPASAFRRSRHSAAAEAYRYLRVRLDPLIASTEGAVVLLVAGARGLEGRTSVAVNLAASLAHAGSKVILVDADLKRPSLTRIFGTGHRPGLVDLLAGRASLDEVAVPTDLPRLRLVIAGETDGQTSDILQGFRLSQDFTRMKATADVIVVDSAPVLEVSDALTLAFVSDLALVVADSRRTRREDARSVAQQIRAVGLENIVGVLNKMPRSLGNRRPWLNLSDQREWVATSTNVPAILGSLVPPRGPNGKGGTPRIAAPASRHTGSDPRRGGENDRPSWHDPQEGE